ncbi:cardiolipin synthase B, partial [Streptomyces sp. NPDC049970]
MTSRTDERPVSGRPDGQYAERTLRLRRRLERLIGIAATEGNEVVPLRNGDQIFAAMLGAIRGA